MNLKSLAAVFGLAAVVAMPEMPAFAAGPQDWSPPKQTKPKKKTTKKKKTSSTKATTRKRTATKKSSGSGGLYSVEDPKLTGAGKSSFSNPQYARAVRELGRKQYSRALPRLQKLVKAEPGNADAWNLLGYASRKTGKMDASWNAYRTALKLNPDHKLALEYLGEWYLQKKDVAGAQDLHRRLVKLCPKGCRERGLLENAIIGYSVGTLKPARLKDVQSKLASGGYYKGPIDGQFGKGSRAALKSFQLARNIDEVGLQERTLSALAE